VAVNLVVVRNVLIVLLIAAVVVVVPGGGSGANVLIQALSLGFLAAAAWVASIVYRENRGSLHLLGDGRRAVLYGAFATLAVTLTATSKLWASSAGSVAWLVLVVVSVYVGTAVIWSTRRY
jgi:hypothetical protein